MKNFNWTLKEIERALSIKLKKNSLISNILINSALVKEDDLFIPIKGKNYDGHQFIKDAINNGASYSLATKKKYKKFKLDRVKEKIILVKNINSSLYNLAKFARKRISGKILGITGSVGKTSIKEAIIFILKEKIKIQSNKGNYNNLIGMPLSLVNFRKNIDLGILELGMNRIGEIKKLSHISRPDIALISKISDAHIGNFKSIKDIAISKSQIFSGMNTSGIAILNHSDPYSVLLKERAKLDGIKNFIFFGKSKECDVKLLDVQSISNDKFKIFVDAAGKKIIFNLNSLGKHWIENSLAIISFFLSINEDLVLFSERISNFKAIKGRGEILKILFNKKKISIIDDSYNSSPESLDKSISFLSHYGYKKRKICVLGDMKELGKFSKKSHLNFKKKIEDNKIFKVYTIGTEMKNLHNALSNSIDKFHADSLNELYSDLKTTINSNDVILFKGSRTMQLDKIINKFK